MKRGVSPLLSFILVLLLALAIYIFLFPWFTTITQKFSEGTEASSERPLHCDNIYLSVNKVTRKRDEINVTINVKNSGTFIIERFTVTRETAYHPESSCLMLNTDLEPNENKDIVVPIFSPFNLTSSLCPGQINPAQIVPCINIKKIELVPWINVDGVDIACVDRLLEVDVENANKVCQFVAGACNSDETRLCYTGDQSLIGTGVCWWGDELCVNNAWSGNCAGEVLPSPEICDGLDNNCINGIDEGIAAQSCYTGIPQSTQNNPPCHAGTWTCNAGGVWGPICNGEQTPLKPNDVCLGSGYGNGVDEDCDGVIDDGCLVWISNKYEFEDSITVSECDCGTAGGYGGSYSKCSWFLAANYCSRNTPIIDDFGSCKNAINGGGVGQCVFLKNADDPNLIGKDRWFAFNLGISIADPSINLNSLECDVKVRLEGASDQNHEDLFIMTNGQSITYLDDLNNPVDTWEERTIGRYEIGRLIEGSNTIRVGNPKDPPEDAINGLISSTHGDWFKFYCYNPIVNP